MNAALERLLIKNRLSMTRLNKKICLVLAVLGLALLTSCAVFSGSHWGSARGGCEACRRMHAVGPDTVSDLDTVAILRELQGHWQQALFDEFAQGEAVIEGAQVMIRYREKPGDELTELTLEVQRADGGTLYTSETGSGLNYFFYEEDGLPVLHFEVRVGSFGYRELKLTRTDTQL